MGDGFMPAVALTGAICLFGVGLTAALVIATLYVSRRDLRRSLQAGFWLAIVPLAVPAVLTTVAVGFASVTLPLVLTGETAPGIVVDNTLIMDGSGDPAYVASVTFETRTGRSVRFDDPVAASNPPQYAIGQSVTVVYPADAPERAMIRDPMLWNVPAGLLAMAVLFAGVFGGIGWSKFRGQRRRR